MPEDRNPGTATKRRRSATPDGAADDDSHQANEELPQPFDARRLEPAKKRVRSRSPSDRHNHSGGGSGTPSTAAAAAAADLPRKPKRPGQRARITDAEREAIRQRALERERQQQQQQPTAGTHSPQKIDDVVRSHYNAVPQRGREWRKTASTIKGLRALNNWVKSCIIQKFSPDDEDGEEEVAAAAAADEAVAEAGEVREPGRRPPRGYHHRRELLVLDIGCGKGGDLGKWNQAPQRVQLYVGLDPANVSIEQARDRYREMVQRGGRGGGRGGGFRGGSGPAARLFDARLLVKDCFGESIGDVGIVREVGFDDNPLARKGFDVVSMMFCMHYAFETEQKARTMLKNVAGALKKGGRFIGCIPNSAVLGEQVQKYHERRAAAKKAEGVTEKAETADGEKTDTKDTAKGTEKDEKTATTEPDDAAEWGNSIYRVRFPGPTPADGVFRPPFGWKYNFFLNEAVEEVPEYVVPWHAFRALAEDYNLELQYYKTFPEVWAAEKDDRVLGPLSERMSVRDRRTGALLVSPEEMEAAAFYVAFCFYKV